MVNCCVCWKESNPLVFRQFHRFPANAERRQKWFNTIGRNITAYKNATICSDHFTEEDYYYCGTPAHSRRLQKTAIPSVLLQRSRKNFEQPSTSCSIENVNPQESIMDIQHKSKVNNEQSTKDIQQDIICAEPTLVKENVTNRKRKRHFCEKNRIFIQTDKNSKAVIRKTDFVNVEAWNKFVKFLNYSRYIHKRSVKQLHLKKKYVMVKFAVEMLKTKNLVIKDILGSLRLIFYVSHDKRMIFKRIDWLQDRDSRIPAVNQRV